MRISTAQLPKPPDGADRVMAAGNFVVVLDGANAIEPVSVEPGVYADHLGASITAALTADPDAALREVLAAAIEAAARALGLAGDHCPSNTVAMARVNRDGTDLLVLGDSFISLLCRLQCEQRKHRNRPEGYWIAETCPAAAAHARTLTLPASTASWAVLATDGAVNTARHLGLDRWPAIAHYRPAELTQLLQHCHDWEEHADPHGQRFPRAKRHDDKTIASVLIR